MAKIGLFFGTQTGNTQTVAEQIQKALGGSAVVDVIDIAEADVDDFRKYEYIIIGCPTWKCTVPILSKPCPDGWFPINPAGDPRGTGVV